MWTRWETLLFLLYATLLALVYHVAHWTFLQIPWPPVAVVGTAVAFIVGFQNNATYGRIWEARTIWGGIVNESRSFAMKVSHMVTGHEGGPSFEASELESEQRVLVDRHFAWLTALRHAMRARRPWEEFGNNKTNREWRDTIYIPELRQTLEDELALYLSADELQTVLTKSNPASTLLFLQSRHLCSLKDRGALWEFSFLELENLLQELFALQGKSERIKNFPYPRQYGSLGFYFVRIFTLLVPLAVVPAFASASAELLPIWIRPAFAWSAVPFCVLISWLFYVMERVGRAGENPFEGSPNDVPISTIARGIEIDIRQMRGDDPALIPPSLPAERHTQM